MEEPDDLRVYLLTLPLIGGGLLGAALKHRIEGSFGRSDITCIIWGVLLGGVSIFAGIVALLQTGEAFLLLLILTIYFSAAIRIGLVPDSLVEALTRPPIRDMVIGGLILSGGYIAGVLFNSDQFNRIVILTFTGGFGAFFFFSGLKRLFKS